MKSPARKYISKAYPYAEDEFSSEGAFLDKYWNEANIDYGVRTKYVDTSFRLKVIRR